VASRLARAKQALPRGVVWFAAAAQARMRGDIRIAAPAPQDNSSSGQFAAPLELKHDRESPQRSNIEAAL